MNPCVGDGSRDCAKEKSANVVQGVGTIVQERHCASKRRGWEGRHSTIISIGHLGNMC